MCDSWQPMRILLAILFVLGLSPAYAQLTLRTRSGVVIQHNVGEDFATLTTADAPRPLSQAIAAVQTQYGWVVDLEEPPRKSPSDYVEVPFQSTYAVEPNFLGTPLDEEQVLNKIVSDYNQTTNPGNYEVRKQIDGSYVVTGNAIRDESGVKLPVNSLLDMAISIPNETRTVNATLAVIAQTLYAVTGTKVKPNSGFLFGNGPVKEGRGRLVKIGGDNIPARNLLMQTLLLAQPATRRGFVWVLSPYDSRVDSVAFFPPFELEHHGDQGYFLFICARQRPGAGVG